ncbi:MAG TPA: hypothetical protein VMU92_12305 [Acidobacteriaceae bacterium]|nr:hypothetical protein [Acidobacteriaceae bacterium]
MTKATVGLFENRSLANQAVSEFKAAEIPPAEIRVLTNPMDLPVKGSLGTPHTDFMASLCRDLREMGATSEKANAYVKGVENGGALVMATGTAEQVNAAAAIMNRNHAIDVEELAGLEPALPATHLGSGAVRHETILAGRIRQSGGGARIFVW